MCGIAGILGETDQMDNVLARMCKTLTHRGPDDSASWQNFFTDAQIGLAQCSLRTSGRQGTLPFDDAETGLVVLLDGTIHNCDELRRKLTNYYHFTTDSDAEVLSKAYHRWGKDCLDRLLGEFVLVIYDRSGQAVFIGRDRFGVKPLYFSFQKGNFYFASEIKALFAAGIRKYPAEKQWANYLVYNSYGMPYETFWDGVFQLPAGHYLYYNGYTFDVTRWYRFEERVAEIAVPATEQEALEHFVGLAQDSIRSTLETDQPMGFNMSGGFDSSLLLGLIHREAGDKSLKVFSFYCGDKKAEILWTHEMLAHTGYDLEQVRITPAMVLKEVHKVARMQDEPFDGLSTIAYAHLFKTAHKRGTRVLCDGYGLDEVWADYSKTGHGDQPDALPAVRFLNNDFCRLARRPDYPEPFSSADANRRYRDIFYTRTPALLRFNDRASMEWSTELRKPFLDHRLVEYAFALPDKYRMKKRQDKWIPRRCAAWLLPSDVRLAPKRTSRFPYREWFTGAMSDWVNHSLRELSTGKVASWLDREGIEKEWQHCQTGTADDFCFIWRWLNMHLLLDLS